MRISRWPRRSIQESERASGVSNTDALQMVRHLQLPLRALSSWDARATVLVVLTSGHRLFVALAWTRLGEGLFAESILNADEIESDLSRAMTPRSFCV